MVSPGFLCLFLVSANIWRPSSSVAGLAQAAESETRPLLSRGAQESASASALPSASASKTVVLASTSTVLAPASIVKQAAAANASLLSALEPSPVRLAADTTAAPPLHRETVVVPPSGTAPPLTRHEASVLKLFVLRSAKMCVCAINKVSSTPALQFLQRAVGGTSWAERSDKNLPRWKGFVEANRILARDDWLRVVTLRPPAERFASGFMDKCIRYKRSTAAANATLMPSIIVRTTSLQNACPVGTQVAGTLFDAHVDAVLTVLENKTASGATVDPHFRPLSAFCQLNSTLAAYHIVPMRTLAEGWCAALRGHTSIGARRRESLVKLAAEAFRGTYSGNATLQAQARRHRTPSSELLAYWEAAAERGEPEAAARVMGRVVRLYRADYEMLERRLQGAPSDAVEALMGSPDPTAWRRWLQPPPTLAP
jgi:hypothetical protein